MTDQDPRSLVVLAFDSLLKSQEAFLAFRRLQSEQILVLHDAVFVGKDLSGDVSVVETTDPGPAETAASSGLWGALLGTLLAGPIGTLVGGAMSAGVGALTAKLVDIGIPDATIKEIEAAIPPGASALAVLLSHVNEVGLARELERFSGATLVRSNLPSESVERLRASLATRRGPSEA